jgi:histidine ammonia-lyase
LLDMVANACAIVGIEYLAAAQGCDFHHPLTSSECLERARKLLRERVPTLEHDRHLHPDMAEAIALVRDGRLVSSIGEPLPGIV